MARSPEVPKVDEGQILESSYPRLMHDVKGRLHSLGRDTSGMAVPLHLFLDGLAAVHGPTGVGIIYRDEGYVQPLLDILLLWNPSVQVAVTQPDALAQVEGLHSDLAEALKDRFDTFLDFLDPQMSPTMSDFHTALLGYAGESRKGHILAFSRIEHATNDKA